MNTKEMRAAFEKMRFNEVNFHILIGNNPLDYALVLFSRGWQAALSQQPAQPTVKESLTVQAQPSCEPVAWLHTMDNTQGSAENTALTDITKSSTHPFGRAGIDYSEEFPVTSVPLFSAPPDYESIKSEHSRKMLFVEAFEESSNRVIQELKSDRGELRKSAFEITCELGLLRSENAQLKESIIVREEFAARVIAESFEIIEECDALKAQLASIKSALSDDGMAITFQSMGQYRTSLLRLCK